LTSKKGPFKTATFEIAVGTVHYPADAEPPFAGVALCGGFTNTGPEMASWGPFYASYGIVTIITTTGAADSPDVRANKLLAAVKALAAENTKSGSPLNNRLAGRYGTSGYSMGGGGTTIASKSDPTLKSSVGLAPWGPTGSNVKVPTLLLCGASDTVAPCSMAQDAYGAIADSTPKMMVSIPGTTHFNWFGPEDAGGGISGEAALAFQKVFLEGDDRWKPFLLQSRGSKTTNIQ
jgi:dienelactone hydrolase